MKNTDKEKKNLYKRSDDSNQEKEEVKDSNKQKNNPPKNQEEVKDTNKQKNNLSKNQEEVKDSKKQKNTKKNTKKNSEIEKQIPKSKWYENDYKPQPINWKKTGIVLSVVSLIIALVVLLWGYGTGGFSYVALRSYAKEAYLTMNVDRDISFCSPENFHYKYEDAVDSNGLPLNLPDPQDVCTSNVQFMMDNNLKQSSKIEIGVKRKHSDTNYELSIKDLKWDLDSVDYLSKNTTNDWMKDKMLMEVNLIEIQKVDGEYKVVQLLKNFETRENYCNRGDNQYEDIKNCQD